MCLGVSLDRATWRELSAITVRHSGDHRRGPLALENLSSDSDVEFWAGGVVADRAKLIDTTESVFHIPASMLGSDGQRVYDQGVAFADSISLSLKRAVQK